MAVLDCGYPADRSQLPFVLLLFSCCFLQPRLVCRPLEHVCELQEQSVLSFRLRVFFEILNLQTYQTRTSPVIFLDCNIHLRIKLPNLAFEGFDLEKISAPMIQRNSL